jgi:hypothetical protein
MNLRRILYSFSAQALFAGAVAFILPTSPALARQSIQTLHD